MKLGWTLYFAANEKRFDSTFGTVIVEIKLTIIELNHASIPFIQFSNKAQELAGFARMLFSVSASGQRLMPYRIYKFPIL